MGRPPTVDDRRILEVAREVFLKKGVNASTTEVARKAGVSQASIFKHFQTKQRLFLAAMQVERERQDWVGHFENKRREAGLEEALVDLGVRVLHFFMQVLPVAMVAWSNRGELGISKGFLDSHVSPSRVAQPLIELLEREMRAGRVRRHEPWLVLRTFIGSMQSYALINHLFKGALGPPFTPEEYVRGVVGVLWRGLSPGKESQA